jgi:hypothetical protein
MEDGGSRIDKAAPVLSILDSEAIGKGTEATEEHGWNTDKKKHRGRCPKRCF